MPSKKSDSLLNILESTQDQLKKVQLDYRVNKTAEEYDRKRENDPKREKRN